MSTFKLGGLETFYDPSDSSCDIDVHANPSNRVKSFDKILHRSLSEIFAERSPISEEFEEPPRDRNSAVEPILEQEPVLSKYFSEEELGKLSLLWIAVLGRYEKSAELLVISGADVNEPFGLHDPQVIDERFTILHVLLQVSDNHSLIRLVTDRGADLQPRDSFGRNVLHFAVGKGRIKETEIFLERGADVNAADNRGETPLLAAAKRSNKVEKILPLLVKHGADVTAKTSHGRNILHFLAKAVTVVVKPEHDDQMLQLAKFSIAMGVSLDDRSPCFEYQPIHEAASHRRSEMVKLFLDHGANVNALANNNITPLYLAAGCPEVLDTLLKRGANVDLKTTDGRSALHRACEHIFNEDSVKVLLSAGADVLAEDSKGNTPFALIGDKNIQNPSIKLMLKALALKKACLEPSIELKDETIIKQFPKLWDYYRNLM